MIVPKGAGVGSAHGFLSAPLAFEVVRTRLIALPAFDFAEVNGIFDAMRAEAEAVVRLGAPSGDLTEERTAFMRYQFGNSRLLGEGLLSLLVNSNAESSRPILRGLSGLGHIGGTYRVLGVR